MKNACPLLVVFAICAAAYALTGFAPGTAVGSAEEIAVMEPAKERETGPEGGQKPEITAEERETEVAAAPGTGTETPTAVTPEPTAEIAAGTEEEETPEEQPAEATRRVLGAVDADYFSDALFIGDSRTVGLSEYCAELDERATFYAKVSLTVNNALDLAFVKTEEGKRSVDELLGERQFGKIYLMLGLNEIGSGTDESFAEDYRRMIERIREKQPEAQILIQSIMYVTKAKSDNDRYFNNSRVDGRNAAIAALADESAGIWYLDMNEAVGDGEGNLTASLSFDDVHLKATSYALWYDYLLGHGVVAAEEGTDGAGDDL